jgi:hypothetical protein
MNSRKTVNERTRTANSSMSSHGKNIIRIVAVTAAVLLIPLLAMQFTDGVDWGVIDFVLIGTLLIGGGLTYEFGVTRIRSAMHRLIAGIVIAAAVLLIWAQLAVGIFD